MYQEQTELFPELQMVSTHFDSSPVREPYRFASRKVLARDKSGIRYTPLPDVTIPLSESHLIDLTYACHETHTIQTFDERRVTEALVFAYMAQANYSEQLFSFFHKNSDAKTSDLMDHNWLLSRSAPFRFKSEDRLAPMRAFLAEYEGGIEKLAENLLEKPHETRELLVSQVGWFGMKTSSYWHYLLGGRDLMTLDQHVLEQAAGLGVSMHERYHNPEPRKTGRHAGSPVRCAPSTREYLQIEEDLCNLFLNEEKHNPIFPKHKDKADVALWFNLLWMAGVNEDRRQRFGIDPTQAHLFGELKRFAYPFTDFSQK